MSYDAERADAASRLWALLANHEGEDADAQLVIERALKEYAITVAAVPLECALDYANKMAEADRDAIRKAYDSLK